MPPDKSSVAVEPGLLVAINVASTPVLSAESADRAVVVIFTNNSDTDITVRPGEDGATPGKGVVLKASGGAWREENLATAVCACHHGASGTKNLSVVLL